MILRKAAICNNIGEVYRNSGEFLKALEYYNKQEALAPRVRSYQESYYSQ